MSKNNYITNKAFSNFLVASILTQMVQQLRILADGIIVSNKVGPSALAAINLYSPLETVFYALIMIVVSGAGFLAAIEMGRQNYKRVSDFFSTTMCVTFGIIAVLVGISFLFLPQLINVLADKDEALLYGYTMDYTKIMLFTYLVQVPNSTLRTFISVDGQPRLVTYSILVSFVLNVLLDIVFVVLLDMGIAGAAAATLISDFTGMLMLVRYLFTKDCTFRLSVAKKMTTFTESTAQGVPLQVSMLMLAVIMYFVNQTVLFFKGSEGSYLLAVIMQVAMFCSMVSDGLVELNTSIGGVLLGERDYTSFRKIVYNSYLMLLSFGVAVTLVIIIFPSFVLSVFGVDSSVDAVSLSSNLRYLSMFFMPFMLFQFTANIHIVVGKEMFATIILFLQGVAMVLFPYLFGLFVIDYFWYSFVIMIFVMLHVQWLVSRYLHRRKNMLTGYALLPLLPDDIATVFSVKYTKESVEEALDSIRLFAEISELDSTVSNKVLLCCEELMYNLVQHGNDKDKDRSFDIRLSDLEENFEVRIKDAGKPFDPVIKFDKTAAQSFEDGESMHLGLQIVNNMCDEISHKFMFGLNVTTLKFAKL